jgi:hypothetical protein
MFQLPPLLRQGRFSFGWSLQLCVTMSCDELFGGNTLVNCPPGAHQLKPHKSVPIPWHVSDAISVLLRRPASQIREPRVAGYRRGCKI